MPRATRAHRLPKRLDYALIPAPLDLSLPPASEKNPLPAIIVTPSSPTHEHDFSIAFLSPVPKPTLRERVVTFAQTHSPTLQTGFKLPKAQPSLTLTFRTRTLVLLLLLLFILVAHAVTHRLAHAHAHSRLDMGLHGPAAPALVQSDGPTPWIDLQWLWREREEPMGEGRTFVLRE